MKKKVEEMTDEEFLQYMRERDEQKRLQGLAELRKPDTDTEPAPAPEPEQKPERLPKTALEVPTDGTRPDGLTTRTAARIKYDGEEYLLTKPERYVLSIFVYMDDTNETTKANNQCKSKMTREEVRRFIDLRNSVFALFFLGCTLSHDAYELELLAEMIQNDQKAHAGRKEFTEEERQHARQLQGLFDWNVLRIDAQLRAVKRFCQEHDVPDYLRPKDVADAFDVLRRLCGGRLFDPFADTVQADEVEKSALWYLEQRKKTFYTTF